MWYGIAQDIKETNNKVGVVIILFIIAVFFAPFFWMAVGFFNFIDSELWADMRNKWNQWVTKMVRRDIQRNLETPQYLPDDTEEDKQLRYNEAKEFLERQKK